MNLGRKLQERLHDRRDDQNGPDTTPDRSPRAQPDPRLSGPGRLGDVRLFGGIVGERPASAPPGAGPTEGPSGSTAGRTKAGRGNGGRVSRAARAARVRARGTVSAHVELRSLTEAREQAKGQVAAA